MRIPYRYHPSHFEAFAWILALLLLAFSNPVEKSHYSLCLFKAVGLDHCPGCGLGHGIAWTLKGHLAEGFYSHPLSLPAIVILIYRTFKLLKQNRFIHHHSIKQQP